MKRSLPGMHPGLYLLFALLILSFSSKALFANKKIDEIDVKDFKSSKIYVYDEQNEQWLLLKVIRYFHTDTGRIDSVEVFSPIYKDVKLNDEVIKYSYDELGRTKRIHKTVDDRNELTEIYRYYESSGRPSERIVSVYPDLVNPYTVGHNAFEYDGLGNLTRYKEIKAEGNTKGDSIIFEYDSNNHRTKVTEYGYEPISRRRVPRLLSEISYDGPTRKSIATSYHNAQTSEWIYNRRIIEIKDLPDSPGSTEPDELDLRIFSFKDFLKLLKSGYQEQSKAGDEWLDKEVVERTQNNDGTIFTKRQMYDVFPMIIEEAVTARAALILINGVLNRMHNKTLFYGDNKPGEILTMQEQIAYSWLSRYTLNEINEQILSFATRTNIAETAIEKKSASSERMLTLTTEIYTEQSGEWKSRFKQEFIHTGGEIINVENASIVQPLKVYPNPSLGMVNVQLDQAGKKIRLEVINLQGQLVYSEHINQAGGGSAHSVNLSFLPEGTYIVRASTNTDFSYTKISLVK